MDITNKRIGLGLLCVDAAVIVALAVMHPVVTIIGIAATLYAGYKS